MSESNKTPKRIQLVLSEDTISKLDALQAEMPRTRSMSELIRDSLNLYRWIADQQKDDRQIVAIDEKGVQRVLILPFSGHGSKPPTPRKSKGSPLVIPAAGISLGVFGEAPDAPRIEVVSSVARAFVSGLIRSKEDLHSLTPSQLEDLAMDRFTAMGYEVQPAGVTFRADGGIDFVFWSRPGDGLPIMGAVQVKHRKNPATPIGPDVVRSMVGALHHFHGNFNMGFVVTNTFFSDEARAIVEPLKLYLRARGGDDVMRWIDGDFSSEHEEREFPTSIQLTQSFLMELNRKKPIK